MQIGEHCTTTSSNTNTTPADAAARYLLVSYSGVGAVISVLVTAVNSTDGSVAAAGDSSYCTGYARLSNGSLYSSSVSYGCDFIPEEKYRCTKLSEQHSIISSFNKPLLR